MGFGRGSRLAPSMLPPATSDGDGRPETRPPPSALPPAGTGPAGHDGGLPADGVEPSPAESGIAPVQEWRCTSGPPSDGAAQIGRTVANSKAVVRTPVIMRQRRGARVARRESVDM